jgi:hypothetical protein
MTNPERCSCGAREKNKCSEESEHGTGKMCLKDEDKVIVKKGRIRIKQGWGIYILSNVGLVGGCPFGGTWGIPAILMLHRTI